MIGITLGDPDGIGAEVTAKVLKRTAFRKKKFVVFGDDILFKKYFPKRLAHVLFVGQGSTFVKKLTFRPTTNGARAALSCLDQAIEFQKQGKIDGLVTAPLCKETCRRISPGFAGHTEYLAKAFRVKNAQMMFVTPGLKTTLVTRHIALNRVSAALNAGSILTTIQSAHEALRKHFKISKPRIGVCGLNPHAGEKGTLGREEITKIIPAIKTAQKKGINARGPFSADTIFYHPNAKAFDLIVAMYHDQGLIPVKSAYFTKVVNMTIGLPFVRTSPAHGTAFGIAGKGIAEAASMFEAVKLACRLS